MISQILLTIIGMILQIYEIIYNKFVYLYVKIVEINSSHIIVSKSFVSVLLVYSGQSLQVFLFNSYTIKILVS